MATQPGIESGSDHARTEDKPEIWGWHAEFNRGARIGGWVTIVVLLLMMTSTHYNEQGTLFLGLSAVGLFVGLLWERHRRKNSWRA